MKMTSLGIIAPEKRVMAIDEIRCGDEQEEDGTDEVIRKDQFLVLLGLQEAHAEVIEESGDIDHSDIKQLLPETSFLFLCRGVDHESPEQPAADCETDQTEGDIGGLPVVIQDNPQPTRQDQRASQQIWDRIQ